MKKIIALVLFSIMTFTLIACETLPENPTVIEAEEYTVELQPKMKGSTPESVVVGGVRVQLLSDGLVRIEQADSAGSFCDKASFNCVNRDNWQKVSYTVENVENETVITTERYSVVVPNDAKKLKGVYVTDKGGNTLWKYETKTSTELFLPSPSDELDVWYFTDSPRVIMSENGYTLPDDGTYEDKNGWTVEANALDAFVFVPGGNYKDFLKNFVTLTGTADMLPITGLGFWYSHYCLYTPELMEDDITQFVNKNCPVDIVVCDVDWHTKEFINSDNLPYGYTVNTELIPDIKAFYDMIHSYCLEVLFNDHPHPVDGTTNVLDKDEIVYRTENLTKYLSLGLDYWWYDRNWPGTKLNKATAKLSEYVTGQYLFYEITSNYYERLAEANGNEYARRSMTLSNVDSLEAGMIQYASELASHRYSVQWTGDIQGDDASLKNEINNAVLCGVEMGIPYMSCDLGGHVTDCTDNGYARWIQYGALSPVCRVHAYASWDRKPWNYGEQAEKIAIDYINMRYRLMPTIYALSHENYETGLPLIRRLDINYPMYEESSRNDEYLLGDYILVAPISSSTGNDTRTVFIPAGTWIDVFSGTEYTGPQTVTVTHPLESSPLFVRKGAIVLLADTVTRTSDIDWSRLTLDLYPSAFDAAKVTLYEDDNKTEAYKDGNFRTTDITMDYADGIITLDIDKAIGAFDGTDAKDERTYKLRFHKANGFEDVTKITVDGNEVEFVTEQKGSAMPFVTDGVSCDNDVVTVTFTAPVYKGAEIKIYTDGKVDEEKPDYDSTSLDFTVILESVKKSDVDGNDITAEGTLGWAVFGIEDYNADVYEGIGSSVTAHHTTKSVPVTERWKTLAVDGNMVKLSLDNVQPGESYTVCFGDESVSSFLEVLRHEMKLNVKTVGQPTVYKLYLSTASAGVRVTVRDRAGNRKTVSFDDCTKNEMNFVVTVMVKSSAESSLIFDIVKTCGTSGTNDAVIVNAITVSAMN